MRFPRWIQVSQSICYNGASYDERRRSCYGFFWSESSNVLIFFGSDRSFEVNPVGAKSTFYTIRARKPTSTFSTILALIAHWPSLGCLKMMSSNWFCQHIWLLWCFWWNLCREQSGGHRVHRASNIAKEGPEGEDGKINWKWLFKGKYKLRNQTLSNTQWKSEKTLQWVHG